MIIYPEGAAPLRAVNVMTASHEAMMWGSSMLI